MGSAVIRLANQLRIEIGDGTITEPGGIGARGGFDFPTEWIPAEDFNICADGIDLLYFGTTDRTVGREWPPSDTDVSTRYEDEDVIRDVSIVPVCNDAITISLREEDNAFRINGEPISGGLYGSYPNFAPFANRTDFNRISLPFTTDFRPMYATLIDKWIGGTHTAVLPGSPYSLLGFL